MQVKKLVEIEGKVIFESRWDDRHKIFTCPSCDCPLLPDDDIYCHECEEQMKSMENVLPN